MLVRRRHLHRGEAVRAEKLLALGGDVVPTPLEQMH
jgi:hypothetical protein